MSSMRSRRTTHETARQDLSRVRVRRAGARLQGRPHARPVPDRARQDSPEPVVGNVRAAPATARDRDQAGAPAGAAALHQGIRRLTVGRWLSLVALSFAALRADGPAARRRLARVARARDARRPRGRLAGHAGVGPHANARAGVNPFRAIEELEPWK